MLRSRILVLVLLTLCISVMAYAGGFQLNEAGARAMAQAGAFAARANDGSAIFFNPAGLAFQKDASICLGTTVIFPKTSFYGPYQNNSNERTDLEAAVFTPINFYAATPLPWLDGLSVGFGVDNPFGLGTTWPDNWVGKFITVDVQLQSFYFTPTIAYRVADFLSIGAGFNYVTGHVSIKRAVATPFSTPDGKEPRVDIDMNGTGIGWNAGALLKITPEISLGVSYRSSAKVDADGDATFTPAYSALPTGGAAASLTLPPTGFAGIAYTTEDFDIEADYQYIGWSTYDKLSIEFAKDNSVSESPKDYQNTYILRLGGEYRFEKWQLRAGFLYDHSPVKLEFSEPLLPDADRFGYNIGFGYKLTDNLNVDFAWLFLKFKERKAENTVPEINFDGTYKSYANLFGVNFEYKF